MFGGSLHRSKSLNESTHYVLRSKTCQPVAFEERKCTGSLLQTPAMSQSRGFSQFQLSFRTAPRWVPAPPARSPVAGMGVQSQAKILFSSLPIVAAMAELERNIIVERIRGGIRRTREQGKRLGRRPLTDPSLLRTVLQMKAQGKSNRAIADALKVSKSFVHKTRKNSGPQTLEIPACQN